MASGDDDMGDEIFAKLSKAYLEGLESAYLPEILGFFLSEDEARLLLELPGTIREVSEAVDTDEASISATLEELYRRGFVLRKKLPDGLVYALLNDLLDFMLHDKDVFDRLPDPGLKDRFLDLCNSLFENELSQDANWSEQVVPQVRVIPVEKTISMRWGDVLPLESASAILASARTIARSECTCRVMARNCDNPTDVCILFDDFAEIFIDRGVAERISKEEALKILERCEELGLVHHLNNADVSGYEFLCNCCTCCCMVLRGMAILGKDDICYRSRYLSKLEEEKCTACGACLDRCQFKAITMTDSRVCIDENRCFGCGLCASGCPEGAVELVPVRGSEHIADNLPDASSGDAVEEMMIMRKSQ